MLHLLRVEFHELEADGADRTPAAQAMHPGERVADTRLQRGWQPASTTTPIEKPWLAIAGVALVEARVRLVTAMGELRRPHHLPTRIVDHGEARGLAAWVDLEPQRLRLLGRFTFLE